MHGIYHVVIKLSVTKAICVIHFRKDNSLCLKKDRYTDIYNRACKAKNMETEYVSISFYKMEKPVLHVFEKNNTIQSPKEAEKHQRQHCLYKQMNGTTQVCDSNQSYCET